MPYRIAVTDNSPADRAYLTSLIQGWSSSRQIPTQITEYPSAEAFLFNYAEDKSYDILLLDIMMGKMNGMTLAKTVRETNSTVQIIFITGFPDFMAEGYEVSAIHYLMKPVSEEKLRSALDKAAANLAKAEKRLSITYDRQTDLIPLSQITFIEAQRQYILIHTTANPEPHKMKCSLTDVESRLDEYFFKCQRSFIVNLRHIKRINPDRVTLTTGEEVPISRGMAEKIGKQIIKLF